MARVILIAVVLVLFIQLASSQQQACDDASDRLQSNIDSGQCDSASAICRSPCRGYVNAVFDNCGEDYQITLIFDDGQVC